MPAAWAINEDAGSPEYNAQDLRRITSAWLWPGVSDRFGARPGVRPGGDAPVSVSGTTWTVHDLAAVVHTAASGPYVVAFPEESGSTTPADGSNPRIDALDLEVLDDDEDESGQRLAQVVYVDGSPAGAPSPPSLVSGRLRLATILVPAGGSPSPSVQTLAQFTVAAGGVLPVASGGTLPTAGVHEGAYADQDEALVRRTGSAWVPMASPNAPTVEVFTGSGSFVKADYPWGHKARVRTVGGGGGGGGANASSSPDNSTGSSAGGGGGGGYAEKWIDFADMSASEPVTVGDGGSGGAAGNNGGSSGGGSSFGSHVSASGGGGGGGSASAVNTRNDGGDGGVGSNGDVNLRGGDGGNGSVNHGSADPSGFGGGTPLAGVRRTNTVNAGGDGNNGYLYGGGGSGGRDSTGEVARAGGDGADGVVIVEVY